MKKVFFLFLVPLCLGLMGMESCFPGDGFPNPDVFGLSGHGPALSYTDNGDGTVTDDNTGVMWEMKAGSVGTPVDRTDATVCPDPHNVNNRYTWTDQGDGDITDPDGTLFTVFLPQLNDVAGGGANCFAGYCDWCIPNVKRLQSIVDYAMSVRR